MATNDFPSSLAPITREGLLCVVSALQLKHASLLRALRAETNDTIRSLRQVEADQCLNLANAFRQSAS
jgi:hypothetical protein